MNVPDLQPDELEALQAETGRPEPAVHVLIDGPVRTQSLPRKAAGSRTRTITTTSQKILSADHRRASATLLAAGNFLIAFNSASASDPSTMALWLANVPYPHTSDSEVWVAAATGTVILGIITEAWAAGE